jgi:lipopolysaccharide/colanic/teichoic acid biosynthesis glycosyltransferase
MFPAIQHCVNRAERALGDRRRLANRALEAPGLGQGGKRLLRSFTDGSSVINGVADFCPWPMMWTVNMDSESLNRQMQRRGSEFEMRMECPGGSAGAFLPPANKTATLPRASGPESSLQANGWGLGGQWQPSAIRQVIIQKQVVDRCDISFSGVADEQTTGLPLWKRALDLALILVFLPGLLILGLVTALVVICGSRGPVLFRQRRVGHRGREFTCYKFRTMQANAETDSHRDHFRHLMGTEVPMTKLDARCDPRLIPMGALLRTIGLDELPQLLNVIRGEMSLVGPRPCIPYEYECYETWQRRRFDAVPGLTGLWQVSGKNRTTFNEMIRLDIEYSVRASLGFDLKILLRTLPALWKQYRESKALKRAHLAQVSAGMAKTV